MEELPKLNYPQPDPDRWRFKRIKNRTSLANVSFGPLLPCVMVIMRISQSWSFQHNFWAETAQLIFHAVMGCSLGAWFLTELLFKWLAKPERGYDTPKQFIKAGALDGAAIAFLNLPGFLAVFYLLYDDHAFLRIVLLFAVAGSTCGMWIGWQVWRALHPEEKWLPRFSLKTLLLLVLMWGTVLLAFQPDRGEWTQFPQRDWIPN